MSEKHKTPSDAMTYKPEELPEWARWKGEDDPPASWWAVNPVSNENIKVYRSYADYCDD